MDAGACSGLTLSGAFYTALKGGACRRRMGQRTGIVVGIEEMIRNNEFENFEMEFVKRERVDVVRNFRIVDALYREAVTLGVLPLKNPLEGIEVDLKVAKVVNRV